MATASEIIPGLAVGGALAPVDGYTAVVDMLGEGRAPDGVSYSACPMDDEPVIRDPEAIRETAQLVADLQESGERVLVRCALGLNRSGLVAARALVALGHRPEEAVRLVREHRSPLALSNPVFEAWVLAEATPVPDSPCPLCRAERLTPRHFEDDESWIADCLVCGTPMVVWRRHGLPDRDVEARLIERLESVALPYYSEDGYSIDSERQMIPDHWHAHARPSANASVVRRDDCSLCSVERELKPTYETGTCWATECDCTTCHAPMIVWRARGPLSQDDEDALFQRLVGKRFGRTGYYIDFLLWESPGHWHGRFEVSVVSADEQRLSDTLRNLCSTIESRLPAGSFPPLYFHGGIPGLQVGDRLLPRTLTGHPQLHFGRDGEPSPADTVFVSTDPFLAKKYAENRPEGGGAVYRVRPLGWMWLDPADPSVWGLAWACLEAVVEEVLLADCTSGTAAPDADSYASRCRRCLSRESSPGSEDEAVRFAVVVRRVLEQAEVPPRGPSCAAA